MTPDQSPTDLNTEFGSGWRVLLASFLGIGVGVSSLYFYSLGVFIKPMAAAFHWTRGEASLGALVGTACAALASIPTGRLVDRLGSLTTAVASLALLAVGFASLGAATGGLVSFLVITAVVSLVTAGSSPLPYTRVVVSGFVRNRGFALGIVLAGTGVGAIVIPAFLPAFIAERGWRIGYYALAAIIVVVLPIVWYFLRDAHGAAAARAPILPLRALVGTPAFRLLGAIFFLASVAVLGTVVHFVPMLTDAGFPPAKAGRTAALIGVSAIVGRVLLGVLLDRTRPWLVTSGLFAAVAAGLVILALGGPSLAVFGALVVGLSVGAEVDLMAFLTGRYFERAVYGQIYGALYTLFLVGGAMGPALSGLLYDLSGSYRLSLLGAAGLLIASAALSTRLSRLPSWAP